MNEVRLGYVMESAAGAIACTDCPVWFDGLCEGHLDGENCLDHLWGYLHEELT